MTTIDDRYHDLFTDDDDPGLARLVGDLDKAYTTPTPLRMRGAFMRLLQEQPVDDPASDDRGGRFPHRTWRPRRRTLSVAAAVAVAALVTGSAFAAQAIINHDFDYFVNGDVPAAGSAAHQTPTDETPILGSAVNLSRTICGYTVTVNRLYADVNRAVVGFTITWAGTHAAESYYLTPTLTDGRGSDLRFLTGAGDNPHGNVSGNAAVFDASSIAHAGTTLALRLTIPGLRQLQPGATLPAHRSCVSVGKPFQDAHVAGGLLYRVTTTGSFTFDVTAPVTFSVRALDLNQTLTSSHGTKVTLERVVVTPSEARVYLHGPLETYLAGGPPIAPVLEVGGKEIDAIGWPLPFGGRRETDSFGNVGVNLYRDHSEWTLKVLTDPVVRNYSRSWTDAVTFHVKLP